MNENNWKDEEDEMRKMSDKGNNEEADKEMRKKNEGFEENDKG